MSHPMKKPTKATAGTRHAKAIAHDLRFGPGDYQSRIDRATRRIDAAIRRAVKVKEAECCARWNGNHGKDGHKCSDLRWPRVHPRKRAEQPRDNRGFFFG